MRCSRSGRAFTTHRNHFDEVMPLARRAHFDDVGPKLIGPFVELRNLFRVRDATPVRRKPSAEHVCDEHQLGVLADRAIDAGRIAERGRCPDQFGVRIADLMLCESTTFELVDEMTARQSMIDDARYTEA